MPFNWDQLLGQPQPPDPMGGPGDLAQLADIYGQTPAPSSDRIASPSSSPALAWEPSQGSPLSAIPDVPPAMLPARPAPVAPAPNPLTQSAMTALGAFGGGERGIGVMRPEQAKAKKQDYPTELAGITVRREQAATQLADVESARAEARAEGLASAGKDLAAQ